jgi:hypothetical protein
MKEKRRTTADFLVTGYRMASRRKGLALLLYAVNLILSLAVAIPVFFVIQSAVSDSGFGPDLAKEFNLPVMADIWNRIFRTAADGGTVGELKIMGLTLLLTIPLLLVWKSISAVGIINAVRDNGLRGFWQGVGRYAGKSILLAIPYFLLSTCALIGLVVLMAGIGNTVGTEAGIYWSTVIGLPVSWLLATSLLDLMHDYSRIGIVARDESVLSAFGNGFAWPFKHRQSVLVYGAWFVLGTILLLLPLLFDSLTTAGTWTGIVILTALQQMALYFRATVTVGWFTSEVEYFEHVRFYDEPLIAESDETTDSNFRPSAQPIADTEGLGGEDLA